LYKNKKYINWKKTIIVILSIIIIASLTILSWYIFKEFQIRNGQDLSNIKYVTQDIYQGENLVERLISAFDKYFIIRSLIEKIISAVMFVLLFASIFKKESRWISLFLVYPFLLFWGFYFSYDHRNLAVILPFISYSCTYGLYLFIEIIQRKWPRLRKYINFKYRIDSKLKTIPIDGKKIILFLSIIIFILILTPSILINSNTILNQQRSLQRKLGCVDLNNLIYDYASNNKIDGQILTDYWFLGLLPEFKDESKRIAFPGVDCNTKVYDVFYDNNPFKKTNDNINYYLLSDRLNPEYINDLDNKITAGKYQLIFEHEIYVQEDNRIERYKFIKIK